MYMNHNVDTMRSRVVEPMCPGSIQREVSNLSAWGSASACDALLKLSRYYEIHKRLSAVHHTASSYIFGYELVYKSCRTFISKMIVYTNVLVK